MSEPPSSDERTRRWSAATGRGESPPASAGSRVPAGGGPEHLEDQAQPYIARLVAEVKRLRQALAAVTRFRTIVDQAGEAIFLVDRATRRIVDVNETACRWVGVSRRKLLSLRTSDLELDFPLECGHPDTTHVTDTRRLERPVILGGGAHRRRNGSVFPVEVAIAARRFGERDYDLIVARECLPRRHAEGAAREAEDKYRVLLDLASDAIYSTGRDGTVTEANRAALSLFGYSREEFLAAQARALYGDPTQVRAFQMGVEERGQVREMPITLRRKDGSNVPAVISAALRHGADRAILGYQCVVRAAVTVPDPDGVSNSVPLPAVEQAHADHLATDHAGEPGGHAMPPSDRPGADELLVAPEPVEPSPGAWVASTTPAETEAPPEIHAPAARDTHPDEPAAPIAEVAQPTERPADPPQGATDPSPTGSAPPPPEIGVSQPDQLQVGSGPASPGDWSARQDAKDCPGTGARGDPGGAGPAARISELISPPVVERRGVRVHVRGHQPQTTRELEPSRGERSSGGWVLAGLVGLAASCAVWSGSLADWYPFGNPAWPWVSLNGFVGFALVLAGFAGRGRPIAVRILAVVVALMGVAVLAMYMDYVRHLPFALGDAVPETWPVIRRMIGDASVFTAASAATYLTVALYLWRAGRVRSPGDD